MSDEDDEDDEPKEEFNRGSVSTSIGLLMRTEKFIVGLLRMMLALDGKVNMLFEACLKLKPEERKELVLSILY